MKAIYKGLKKIMAMLIIAQLFIACQKIEIQERVIYNSLECLNEVDYPPNLTSCDTIPNSDLCEIVPFGEFNLLTESKTFMPLYCLELNSEVDFINEFNEVKKLRITSKSYQRSKITSTVFTHCEFDSTKYIGYCLENEDISIQLTSNEDSVRFIISISTYPDVTTSDIGLIGDILTISRDNGSNIFQECKVSIGDRTLTQTYLGLLKQEYFDNILLLGEEFSNVYSNSDPSAGKHIYKYFYNSKYGLIAFVGLDGQIWKLNQ